MHIKREIETRLQAAFSPTDLEVIDQSEQHRGHQGVDRVGETHFLIRIKSQSFEEKSAVEIHRAIYKVLDTLMDNPIHALSIEYK